MHHGLLKTFLSPVGGTHCMIVHITSLVSGWLLYSWCIDFSQDKWGPFNFSFGSHLRLAFMAIECIFNQ